MKLTPSLKRKISKDWLSAFPGMGLYKPMWLMRRTGPLLIGVVLDRDSSNERYWPRFHVHCLGTRLDFIALSLATPLSGGRVVSAGLHEKNWKSAAELMSNIALLPLSGDVLLESVESAYLARMDGNEDLISYESLIVLCGWCGQSERALHFFRLGLEHVAAWPQQTREFYETHRGYNSENWHNKYSTLAVSPEAVQAIIAEQVVLDKNLQKLPVAQLLSRVTQIYRR